MTASPLLLRFEPFFAKILDYSHQYFAESAVAITSVNKDVKYIDFNIFNVLEPMINIIMIVLNVIIALVVLMNHKLFLSSHHILDNLNHVICLFVTTILSKSISNLRFSII